MAASCAFEGGTLAEPLDGSREALVEADPRFPAELTSCQRDVRLADARVVDGPGNENDLAVAADQALDRLSDVEHRGLVRIADVDRAGEVAAQQAHDPLHEVVDIDDRPGLRAVACHRDRPTGEGLGW